MMYDEAVRLDPRRILTFRAVARERSFSRAAEALALTQPAVSQQVAALERRLGMRLLDRAPGGLTLTGAGGLLLQHADALAERLALADRQLAELGDDVARRLRVGAHPSALATVVPAAVSRLTAEDPRLAVEAGEGTVEALTAGVTDGRLHAAVLFQDAALPRREPAGLVRHDVAREAMFAALPPGHRLAGRGELALAELAEDTWLAPSREHLVRRACVAAGFEPRISHLTRDPLAIRGLVAAGLGVTLVPQLLAGLMPGVHLAALSDGGPLREIYALVPAAGVRPAALAFVAAVTEEATRLNAATAR
jgi:DNA-binding transcriptional LysR family regulator